jgi:hypothetical protein
MGETCSRDRKTNAKGKQKFDEEVCIKAAIWNKYV